MNKVNLDELTILPECYLVVEECSSGTLEVFALADDDLMDLETLVDQWITESSCGELVRDGDIMPQLQGEYYAWIQTDQRPLDSVVVWESGGFYIREAD